MTGTATTSDHGGLYYIELIKSNLQYIHGKDCSFEVLSQVKAPDQWKVNILKTEGGHRSTLFFDSGVGFLNVLEKLHRKSAEKLSKYMADKTADAHPFAKRKAVEAMKAARAASGKDEMKEKTPSKTPVSQATVEPTHDPRISNNSDYDSSDDFSSDSISVSSFARGRRAQSLWRGRNLCDEIISIKADPSLRSRSYVCPNYGPASAFYRVTPSGRPEPLDEGFIRNILKADRERRAAEKREAEAAKTASAPAVAPAVAPEAIKDQVRPLVSFDQVRPPVTFEAEPQVVNDFERLTMQHPGKKQRVEAKPALRNVIVYIRWPDFGDAVVADECQLSVRGVQSHIRDMLKAHGANLFTLTRPANALMFMTGQLDNFTIALKAISFDDQRFMLGPKVGDDLTKVSKDSDNCKSIKIEVELKFPLTGMGGTLL
ncbi:hypothetical protein N5P37_007930 [Trichoderma harzianum]|uniref:Uncharacterized protein n=1 Tax=Trichoderma harzianum CBS 226.95 TaxID=983964 RepID=A0A2T4A3L2_TRIHA|nr:hypothetical protein M431DRAFT_484635 [Trichoderma harzianum CBS 226.95]KAK0759742.1 hypothetical protein N5P37_007930 [Trichoderma harzianum]PTB51665.1 hypothetical protein M431DRAFT_484635 [Trichoderma harzianum CBS 226.95]